MKEKKRQLRKHQAFATGLFLLMALLYIVFLYAQKHSSATWLGYAKAFSEAALVGALADWFAVTALFKHPLGLKIPHTNLIESNQNVLGENLGSFVTENFLTPTTIRPYIERLDVARFLADGLEKEENKQLLETEICLLIERLVSKVDKQALLEKLTAQAQARLDSIPLHHFAAQILTYTIEKKEPDALLHFLIPKIQEYVARNQESIYQAVIDRKPFLALLGGKAVTHQLVVGIAAFLEAVANNPEHPVRMALYEKLNHLVSDLTTNPYWEAKLKELLKSYLTHERLTNYAEDFYDSLQRTLVTQLQTPQSTFRLFIHSRITDLQGSLKNDEIFRHKINAGIRVTLYKLVLKNANEMGALIENTVKHWDGRELSEKLELEVGKDLQFIRINGTLIGGLVGLILYTITHFLF